MTHGCQQIQGMPAQKQADEVVKKLQELNPGMGAITPESFGAAYVSCALPSKPLG